MNPTTLKSLLILWSEQGLLKGDLNQVQQYCLSWVLTQESETKVDLLKIQTLATNPDVYKAIFETDPLGSDEGEWRPIDPTEEAEVMAEIDRWQAQRQRDEL